MSISKSFLLEDILTITTGKKLNSGPGLESVHKVLSYLLGSPVPASMAAVAALKCREVLVKQHPVLASTNPDYVSGEWSSWLDQQVQLIGTSLELTPASPELQQEFSEILAGLPIGESIVGLS